MSSISPYQWYACLLPAAIFYYCITTTVSVSNRSLSFVEDTATKQIRTTVLIPHQQYYLYINILNLNEESSEISAALLQEFHLLGICYYYY